MPPKCLAVDQDLAMDKTTAVITIPIGTSLNDAVKTLIEATLSNTDGNISVAAKILGIDRSGRQGDIQRLTLNVEAAAKARELAREAIRQSASPCKGSFSSHSPPKAFHSRAYLLRKAPRW